MDQPTRERRGLLIVLSSPSGAGKSTISRMLLDADKDVTGYQCSFTDQGGKVIATVPSSGATCQLPAGKAPGGSLVTCSIAPVDAAERFRALGVRVIQGYARFTDRRTVTVGDAYAVRARRFVVATGARAAVPPIPGLDAGPYLTN